MEDATQLKQSVIEKLNDLSEEKLVQVLDFIELITTSQPRFEARPDMLPAPDAFVECAGTWEFEPGELEEILQDIEHSRLMELEEDHGNLLD